MRTPSSRPSPRVLPAFLLPALALALPLPGCSGGGVAPAPPPLLAAFASLGELEDAIDEAQSSPVLERRADTDGDSIPDDIEGVLGTSPAQADTDRDGLVDTLELFGAQYLRSDPLPDLDRDGQIAPVDDDDDGDRRNDGLKVDTDGDGVANALEIYGYGFDVLTGQFVPWNGDPAIPHVFTDPLQPSTDQDAYPDGMEASRRLSDPTVRAPGDDPLVPAYPNLVCELVSYAVTLDEDVQITESESFSKGQSWSRQTDYAQSHGVENTWEIGGELAYGTESGVKVSGKYGQTYENTNSTTTSVGTGGSITTDEGWSVARSLNPTRAARLKLYMRMHNRGTAPVSNLVPTLALRIGGLNVATFRPAGTNVNLLVPGATYPSEPGWLWVVDAKDTGGGSEPLHVTMSELRAIERGAPISLAVTQVEGDAMRLREDGAWESVGDTNEFTARCDAVCANLRIELADGTLVHHLVYAGEGPYVPAMTLGRALGKLGVDEDGVLHYADRDGTPRVQSLDGFHAAIDAATLRANGWALAADDPTGATATAAPAGFSLPDLRLGPDSVVYVRAPRPPGAPPEPTVHFATLDPDTGEILVSAADYKGIAHVRVHNQLDPSDEGYRSQDLTEPVPGAGFFSGNARGPGGFEPSDALTAEIENLDGFVRSRALGSLFVAPGPQAPVIHEASLDLNGLRVYANVESGNPENPNSNVEWIRAYHPDFSGGYVDLERVYDYYLDPLGFEAPLPTNFGKLNKQDVQVVAYVRQGVLETMPLSIADAEPVEVRHSSALTTTPMADGANNLLGVLQSVEFTTRRLDFDVAAGVSIATYTKKSLDVPTKPAIPGAPYDVVLQYDDAGPKAWARMYFNAEYSKLAVGGEPTFRSLTRDDIDLQLAAGSNRMTRRLGADAGDDMLRPGDVLALRTTSGLPAKLYVESVIYDHNVLKDQWWANVRIRFVVFER